MTGIRNACHRRRTTLPVIGTTIAAVLLAVAPAQAARAACGSDDGLATAARLVPTLESFSLDNGLRVVLAPRALESSVSVRVAYDIGARDETAGRGGLAHFFEHLMFKGSEQIPDGGHFRLVRDVGGVVNAITDYDTTQYWNTVPTSALGSVLFAEADRMRGPRLSRANLDNQRDAIQEETLGLDTLPFAQAASEFLFELLADTGYGHSPIGTAEELAAATSNEVIEFHRTFYAPANAVLVLAGGFDPVLAKREIDRHFAPIPRGPDPPPRPQAKTTTPTLHKVVTDPLAPFPVYSVIWRVPGATSEEARAVSVLRDMLMGHPDARFDRAIGRERALYGFSFPAVFRDLGVLSFVFAPRTFVDFDEIRFEIAREVAALRNDGPSEPEVCRSVGRERSALLSRLEQNEELAAVLATGVLLHSDPRAFEADLRALAALDAGVLQAVAADVLVEDFDTLEIEPPGAMRVIKSILEFLPASVGASLEERFL